MTASEETHTCFQSFTKLWRETEEIMTDSHTFSRGSAVVNVKQRHLSTDTGTAVTHSLPTIQQLFSAREG